MSVNAQAEKAVQAALDQLTSDPKSGVPGLVFATINKDGNIIQANASGSRSLKTKMPMTLDTVFWVASCGKVLTAIACLQLVEQGKLSLDDSKSLYQLCPELEKIQILQEDGTLRDRKADITLRMLLNHTCGFCYDFFNKRMQDYCRSIDWDRLSADVLKLPLVNEPGSRWEYSTGLDWSGIVLERTTGMKLNDYAQRYIMQPLGLENISFFPTQHMRENLVSQYQRSPEGHIEEGDHILLRSIAAETAQDRDRVYNSGGMGWFAKPTDFIQVLAMLLNDGTSPTTKKQILKPKTVKTMFENQIPQFPQFGCQNILDAGSEKTTPIPYLYPQERNAPQGWGLSFLLNQEPTSTGRGAGAAGWAGLSNQFWWCDPEKGIAGMMASQILPFGDTRVLAKWFECEKMVYDMLA